MNDDISKRVELFLNPADNDEDDGDGDWDGLMADLEEAIAADPGQAWLYRLRARMHAAGYDIYSASLDWARALELAPEDRDTALELATLHLRRADRLAETAVHRAKPRSEAAGDDEEDADEDEDDWDEADEEQAAALSAEFSSAGDTALRALMRSHVGDMPFAQRLLDALDELHAVSPWTHYTLLLQALAAHPGHPSLLAREARFLAFLAGHCATDTDEIPAGYLETLSGQRLHAITVQRALKAIDAVVNPGGALLLTRAELLEALAQYPQAADAYAQAAALLDDEEATIARARAALCTRGRQALIEDQFAMVAGAMEQLAEMRRKMGSEPDDEQDDMAATMAESKAALEAVDEGLDDDERAKYIALAESTAAKTVGLISFEPIVLNPIAESALEGGLSPWYAGMAPELEAAGLSFLAQFDNPANTRALGMQCQGQVWTDAGGASALVAETVKALSLKRLVTELEDHSIIMTVDDRGRSFWQGGPAMDVSSVDAATPIGDMAELHLARVARRLADSPGLRAIPIDSLARLAEVENRAREAKIAFRFDEGITDIEVRGMHVQHHDEFKDLLAAAVRRKLDAIERPATFH
jgi:hypothetical protein